MRRKRGWKSIHSSRKHCGKALRKTTACPILCCCWSLPPPPILIEKRAHRPGRGLNSTQLWGGYKTSPRPKLNLNDGRPMNRRGWLGNTRTDKLGWPGNMRTCELRWLKSWTPPYGRSSEMSSTNLVRLLPWCISTTANPCTIPICYMNEVLATTVQWRADAPMPTTTPESKGSQALGSTSSPAHQTGTPPLPVLPMSDIPPIGTPPIWHSLIRLIIDPQCKQWDPFPNNATDNWPGKRVHAKTAEANVSIGHSTPQGDRELLQQHWRHPTMVWLLQGVLDNMTGRMTLTTMVMNLAKTSWGRTQSIAIWNQPLGIVSLVLTLRRWLLESLSLLQHHQGLPLVWGPAEVNRG